MNGVIRRFKCWMFLIILVPTSAAVGQGISKRVSRIDAYSYKVDMSESMCIDSIGFLIDSIQVSAKRYSAKITTVHFFDRSGSKLKINYYLENGELVLVNVIEASSKYLQLIN